MSHMGDINVEQGVHPNGYVLVSSTKVFAVHAGDAHPDRASGPTSRGLAADVTGGADATTRRVGAPAESLIGVTVAFPTRLGLPRDVMVK